MVISSHSNSSSNGFSGNAPIDTGLDGSGPAAASSARSIHSESAKSSTGDAIPPAAADAATSPGDASSTGSNASDEGSSGDVPTIGAGADDSPAAKASIGSSSKAVPPADAPVENGTVDPDDNVADPPTSTSRDLSTDEALDRDTSPPQPPLLPGKETYNDAPINDKSLAPSFQHDSKEFNVALESLEIMRRLNLEVEFSSASLSFPVDHVKCTYCQREALHKFVTDPPKAVVNGNALMIGEGGITIGKVKLDGSRLRRFRSNVGGFFKKINDDDSKTAATQSCPPSLLASPSNLSSTESIEEEATSSGITATSNATRRNILKKTPRPCLTCGHPTCSRHLSTNFSKNHIPICQPCAYLFELDFLVDVIASTASDAKQCHRKVDHLVDCYDRALLLLVFAAKYADDIATALETRTDRSNRIGAGSSATGIASGVAGVVGCGALLFPPTAVVGVPLLVASLVLGGGASATQAGDAAAGYFDEPNRLAAKMVALHGMVLSLLRITEVLSYGLLKNHLNVNYSVEGFSEDQGEVAGGGDDESRRREALKKEIQELLEKHGVATTQAGVGGLQSAFMTGIVATEVAAAGAAVTTEAAIGTGALVRGAGAVGRGTRYVGRVGTTAAAGARFIPIAGGLLSAACVYVEGKELRRTLSRISEGSPCEKAEQVRSIRDEVDKLPDSSLIAAECRRVFELAQQEKLKKAALAEESARDGNHLQTKEQYLTLEDVNAGDISDMISVMETSATIDALIENDSELKVNSGQT